MRKAVLFFALIFLFFLNFVSAAVDDNCVISSEKSDTFVLAFNVKEDGTAIMKMDFRIPYSPACIKMIPPIFDKNKVACRKEIISDALFRTMDIFVLSTDCLVSLDRATGHLVVETSSETEKIVKENENFLEIRFAKWSFSTEKAGTKNTLEISLPESSNIVSFFPKRNSTASKNNVFWSVIPEEPVSIKYSLQKPQDNSTIVFGLLGLVALIVIVVFAGKFASAKKAKEKLLSLGAEEKALSQELKELEVSYLKRKLDEETYKKLIVEIELKMNKLQIEKRTILEIKNKKTS